MSKVVFALQWGQVCVETQKIIIILPTTYDKSMKIKGVFVAMAAVFTMFCTAVGLCAHALSAPQTVFGENGTQITVALDAGHGGIDGGVTGKTTKVKESDLNLAIVQLLAPQLEEMGFQVVLTRKTQAGLYGVYGRGFKKRDMQRRKEIIQESNPDLVVSVHQNLYPTSGTRGAQVFYLKDSQAGETFAAALQEPLNKMYANYGVKPRVCKAADYFMLSCTSNPSVIVECGFLSNAQDEALLVQPAFQRELVSAIISGIVAYLSQTLS